MASLAKPSRLASVTARKPPSTPPLPVAPTLDTPAIPVDPPVAAPGDGEPESEVGKFRQLLSLLRKTLHVADLSSVRISLPANLLEPIGNLEYWMYCERPDFFSAINEPDDELERMLAVLRWTFTKDLKFVKHKIAKPYNSILGEHFHCHFDTEPLTLHPTTKAPDPIQWLDESPAPEVLSFAGRPAASAAPLPSAPELPPIPGSSVASSAASTTSASTGNASTAATSLLGATGTSTRVAFLNEQTSHHPPISFFMLEARGPKGTVQCVGADQLSAKFTGTTVAVFPGPFNKGLFVTLPERDYEEYQITHPTATVAGLLRGSPYATIGEHCYVTTRGGRPSANGKKLRCIIQYHSESWLMKPKFLLDGVLYEYELGTEGENYTKIKHVPAASVVATLEGCWRGEIRWKPVGDHPWKTLVDLVPLAVAPKTVAPLSEQHELETRKVWSSVTNALHARSWNEASKQKQSIEQAQRVKAEERKKAGQPYLPAYFEPQAQGDEWDGRPKLTAAGREAIEKEFKARYTE